MAHSDADSHYRFVICKWCRMFSCFPELLKASGQIAWLQWFSTWIIHIHPSLLLLSLVATNGIRNICFLLFSTRETKKKIRGRRQESHITYGSLQLSPFRLHFLELSFAHLFHLFSWRPDDSWATGVVCEVLPETDVPFFLLFFLSVLFLRHEDWLTVVRMWICGHFVNSYGRSANASCKRIGVCTTKTFHFLSAWVGDFSQS